MSAFQLMSIVAMFTMVWITFLCFVKYYYPNGLFVPKVTTPKPKRVSKRVCMYHLKSVSKGDVALIKAEECSWCKKAKVEI